MKTSDNKLRPAESGRQQGGTKKNEADANTTFAPFAQKGGKDAAQSRQTGGNAEDHAVKEVKSRYIKPVVFNSVNDVDKIEERVNGTVDIIKTAGGKIISINSQLFGISPMNLIYNIIYEREQALPPTEVEGE